MGFRGYDMKDYLSIGKVAKRKGVSIKSLRYYDEIGILKPAYVNQATNYRYYKEEQLFLIDAITLCIELGIPLKNLPGYRAEDGSGTFSDCFLTEKHLQKKRSVPCETALMRSRQHCGGSRPENLIRTSYPKHPK
jgi:DNA-binding transcriptional MerR regulator